MSEEVTLDEVEWKGTSKATIERIKAEGITTVDHLLTYDARTLSEKIGSQEATVGKVIRQAQIQFGLNYRTALEEEKKRKKRVYYSTGSKELDRLLKGGLESNVITELIGEFKAGKSQLCFTAEVLAVQGKPDKHGRPPIALHLDTEGTFVPARLREIARERGLDPNLTLGRIIFDKPESSDHQSIIIHNLDKVLAEHNVVLIVVDSMLSLLRSEYMGRAMLAERQQVLGKMLTKLLRVAGSHKLAVVVTNQVQAKVDGSGICGDPNRAAGGHIMAHAGTHRVRLRVGRKNTRLVQVIDSPNISDEEKVRIAITRAGVTDEDGSYPSIDIGGEAEGEEGG